MDLTNLLGALTDKEAVGAIANNLNLNSKQVSSVITNALPSLLGAMQQNASTEGGANALAKALGDHVGNAGNILNNLKGADLNDGNKILSHILGGNLSNVLNGISKKTGVASNAVGGILASIAPSLLALLGKGQQGSGTSNANLAGMLGVILGAANGGQNKTGGLGSILGAAMKDRDGDGKPDILGGLGGLFGK